MEVAAKKEKVNNQLEVEVVVKVAAAVGLCKKWKGKSFLGVHAMFWPSWSHDNLFVAFSCPLDCLLAPFPPCCCLFFFLYVWLLFVHLLVLAVVLVAMIGGSFLRWSVILVIVTALVRGSWCYQCCSCGSAVVGGSGCCILAVDTVAVGRFGCFCCCGRLFWLFLLLRSVILSVIDVTVIGWFIPVVAVLSLDDCCWCGSCSCCSGRLFLLSMLLLWRSLTVVAVTIVVLFVFLM